MELDTSVASWSKVHFHNDLFESNWEELITRDVRVNHLITVLYCKFLSFMATEYHVLVVLDFTEIRKPIFAIFFNDEAFNEHAEF